MTNDTSINRYVGTALFALTCAVFLLLVLRNTGLHPTVFADEYFYSKFSRLLPLSDSAIPNYLYLELYRFTNYCGGGFLECAKILNALFFVAAAPFIYLTAKTVTNNITALVVAFLAVTSPLNSYTAYFMPESLYFLGFWIFTWCLLRTNIANKGVSWNWACIGTVYGFTALIKPHSLFFAPAILVYILYLGYKDKECSIADSAKTILIFSAAAATVKILIGYALAGASGITLFGSFYGSVAQSTTLDADRYFELTWLTVKSLWGHLLALTILYGIPLTVATTLFVRQFSSKTSSNSLDRLSILSILLIFNLILVVALFTAWVANSSSYESPYRLHMRYYNFALPLLYIIAAGAISINHTCKQSYLRYLAGGIIFVLSGYALYTGMTPYAPTAVDSPELRGIHANTTVFLIYGGVSLLAWLLWPRRGQDSVKIYLYVALPFFVIVSAVNITQDQRYRLIPDADDKAGLFTKQYLPAEDLSKVVVVGSEPVGLFRAAFHLDNPKASIEVIPRDSAYDISKLPNDKEWALIIGNHPLPKNTFHQISMYGFTLARAKGTNTIDFRKFSWPGVISKTLGLAHAEPWGTWSLGRIVTLEFATPLPEKFDVRLIARAYGPNVNKDFVASVGESVSRFSLNSTEQQEKVLSFTNPKRSKTLRIFVPVPTSPKSLGTGPDDRQLGIGLVEISVQSK
ncbi:hypothetical protein CR155_00015 [Pollutimonas nitritireducens]|uniref:Glycosyltransferase RgtA/B/C/D-like domain-containing protein n=1 Tax=Pollutimonas nitritireducens TaxID=2045209 RepID=A0A2N4UKC1_9BURK|nr:glycosyltransferase family 39 protein [Pollutimonas nitritireducens]PLC55484.1 hypothetical protein CR155_00015 [Pollutimonas nitritireducens]